MRTVFFSYLYIFVHRGLIKHISIANEISVLVYNVSHLHEMMSIMIHDLWALLRVT